MGLYEGIKDVQNDNYDCPLCKAHIVDISTWEHRTNDKD